MGTLPVGARLLISSPRRIDEEIRRLERGATLSTAALRERLATQAGAEACCPLTAGIFLRIVAEAAWDELQDGASPDSVTPFWRVVEPRSPLAKKLRCGPDFIAAMRAREDATA